MTENEFLPWYQLLCESKNQAPSAPMTRMCAQIVQAEGITAEQWARACTRAIRYDRFMPTFQELVEYAKGQDQKTETLAVWNAILRAQEQDVRADIPDAARTILRAATNGFKLADLDSRTRSFAKKEFLEEYGKLLTEQAINATPALLPATPAKELTHASD
jgi:hypothetical protein